MDQGKSPGLAGEKGQMKVEQRMVRECPVCGGSMGLGRGGMWLHYLEAGCDYIAEIEKLNASIETMRAFLRPLMKEESWQRHETYLHEAMKPGTLHFGTTANAPYHEVKNQKVIEYVGGVKVTDPPHHPALMIQRAVSVNDPPF